MFILELVWGFAQLAAFGGGALYVYGDYKRGWSTTRRLWGKAESLALRLTGRQEDGVDRANKLVGDFGRGLDEFRRAVAAIEADIQVSEKQGREQSVLVDQYRILVETALRQGDEKTAAVAAEAKVQAETRARMFVDHVVDQRRVAVIMREGLSDQESNFDIMQTKVVTIQIRSQLAGAKEKLYGLVSEVHVKTGLTPSAELERMRLDAERRDVQAGILLEMAKNRNGQQAKRLLRSAEADRVLIEARNRLALPAAGAGGDSEEEAAVVIDEKKIMVVTS